MMSRRRLLRSLLDAATATEYASNDAALLSPSVAVNWFFLLDLVKTFVGVFYFCTRVFMP